MKESLKQDDEASTFFNTGMSLVSAFCKMSPFDLHLAEPANKQEILSDRSTIYDFFKNQNPLNWQMCCDTLSKISLTIAQNVARSSGQDQNEFNSLLKLLEGIAFQKKASSDSRAHAFYLLGHHHLCEARKNGELYSLWEGCSASHSSFYTSTVSSDAFTSNSVSSLAKSEQYFKNAASLASPASSLLCRKALRCLALSIGPHSISDFGSAGEMIHTSIGSTARQTISRISSTTGENNLHGIDSIFRAYDINVNDHAARNNGLANMYKYGIELVPSDWNFVAMALCPTGELLISSLILDDDPSSDVGFKYRTVCIFPTTYSRTSEIIHQVLKPFDDLMSRSTKQLNGVDLDTFEKFNNDRNAKMGWWEEREKIDRTLHDLLEQTQHQYFSAECVQDLFIQNDDCNTSFNGGNLAAMFEAACSIDDSPKPEIAESKESLQRSTVKDLKHRLKDLDVPGKEFRTLRKAGLIDLLLEKLEEEARKEMESMKDQSLNDTINSSLGVDNCKMERQGCTFLILDEQLCRFPFEGLPLLNGRTICRIPSFPFAISSLHRAQNDSQEGKIDPTATKFVLDPESNLLGTKERVGQALISITESNKWEWNGIVGEIPSNSFMQSALMQENGLLLYFGHNGGERCFSRTQIESLMTSQNDSSVRHCKSSLILMGCSSGVLHSINQTNENDMCNTEIHFEPEGVALSYLCAGAPCVVSNLWDVSDRDIDR